jgi:AcrR family transcriptional regulator
MMARISVEAIRREQLIDAATSLVARKGYEAVTIRDVADAASVSTGTVHYYFSGKDDLLRSVLVEASRRFQKRVEDATGGVVDPRTLLARHAAAATPRTPDELDAQRVWSAFWDQAQRDPQLRDLHERLYDTWRAQLADAVRRGGFVGVDADAWARRYVALIDGLALHVTLHPGSVSPDDMQRACGDYVTVTLHR